MTTKSETITIVSIGDARPSYVVRLARSVFSVVLMTSVVFGPGVIAGSPAMQWAGFIVFIALSCIALSRFDAAGMTIEQARKRLDEMENEK